MRHATMGPRRFFGTLLALVLAATVAVGLSALVGTKPAQATFPGQNGNIAFATDQHEVNNDGNSEIYSMAPFASATQTRLTNNPAFDSGPAYNHDGTKIVFITDRDGNDEIYVMDAKDGSNQTRLTTNTASDNFPSFSLDDKIAFTTDRDGGNSEIYVMDAVDSDNDGNGDNLKRLTANIAFDYQPAFSPDGTRITFTSNRDDNFNIYMMNAVDSDNDGNGDNLKRLTKNLASDSDPSFSPDGTKPS